MIFKNGDKVEVSFMCKCGCGLGTELLNQVGKISNNWVLFENNIKIPLDNVTEHMFIIASTKSIEEFI